MLSVFAVNLSFRQVVTFAGVTETCLYHRTVTNSLIHCIKADSEEGTEEKEGDLSESELMIL